MSVTITTINKTQKTSKFSLYGLLYNWYAVSDARGIAPVGWHVATDADFVTLIAYGGTGYWNIGGKLKETGINHWNTPNTGATNEFGFTLLPAGYRQLKYNDGGFYDLGSAGYIGTSSLIYGCEIRYYTTYQETYLWQSSNESEPKRGGFPRRFVRDNTIGYIDGEIIQDYDQNQYHTIRIGTQVWAVENVAVTHYNNGDVIPEVIDNATWISLSTGALCAYNNDWSEVFS